MKKGGFLKFYLLFVFYLTTILHSFGQFTIDELLSHGLDQFNNKNYNTAAFYFEQALSQNDTLKSAWYNRGLCRLNLRDFLGAEQDFLKLLTLDPTSLKVLKFLGYVDMKMHKIDHAIFYLDKAIFIDSMDVESILNRGILKNLKKAYREALTDFQLCINLNPNLHTIYYNRGLSYMSLKKFKQAISDFSTAIEKNPANIGYLINRANAFINYEQYESAIRDLNAYLTRDPGNDYVKRTLSIARLKLNIQRKGIQVMDSLSYDNPKNIQIVRDRSLLKVKNRDFVGALIDIRTVEKMYPTDAELKYAKGVALYNTEMYERALTEFDKVIELDPKYGWAHYHKAISKKSLNVYKNKNFCRDLYKASDLGVIEATMLIKEDCKGNKKSYLTAAR